MQILTIAFGPYHVEMFRKVCLPSLSQIGNKHILYENKAIWNICTDIEAFAYLKREIDVQLPEIEVRFKDATDLRNYVDATQSAIIWQIEECLRTKTKLLVAPPDNIFGSHSLPALFLASREPDTVVVVPHVRVLPEILEGHYLLPNAELLNLSWKHLHQSWSDAQVGHVRQNSFIGGVRWEYVNEKVISVNHRLPSPFLMSFTTEDLQYFKSQVSFGSFDHIWPDNILIPRGRLRYITSSDQAFIAEVTEKDKNVPPIQAGANPDLFWRANGQDHFNKQILATFRLG